MFLLRILIPTLCLPCVAFIGYFAGDFLAALLQLPESRHYPVELGFSLLLTCGYIFILWKGFRYTKRDLMIINLLGIVLMALMTIVMVFLMTQGPK